MEYQYKVTAFESAVTTSDVRKGNWGKKVCAQLELLLQEHAREGWELQGQYEFQVEIKGGCFDFISKLLGMGSSEGNYRVFQLVFRKAA